MLSAFGFSAWWFVLGSAMIGFFAIRTAWRRMKGETDPLRINPPKITAAVGFLAVLVGSTCLEALRLRRFQMILPGEPGGILGDSLAWGIRHYIGVGLSTGAIDLSSRCSRPMRSATDSPVGSPSRSASADCICC